jgi:hypothetical protein
MTDSEKTLVQNWAYWLERFCEWKCPKTLVNGATCDGCIVRNIKEQMKEELEEGSK